MQLSKKIEQNRITEKEYRGLRDRLNYSSLRLWKNDRRKFYKEVVLQEIVEREETASTILGHLVHAMLSGEFDEKFHIAVTTPPVGQMLDLVDALYIRSLKSMIDGVQQDKFETLFEDAVQKVKYDFDGNEIAFKKKPLEKIVEMFTGDAELYYKEKLSCIGKMVVSINTVQSAERLVERLRTHPFTRDLVNQQTTDQIEVFMELPILFSIAEVQFRSLVDKLIVNHGTREIIPVDYKTSWDSGSFAGSYLKHDYYLQAGLYDEAIRFWAIEHELGDYKILPMKYVVCDTGGFADPLVVHCSKKDIVMAWDGFSVRGWRYEGLTEILAQIAWAVDKGIWTHSKEVAEKEGNISLEIEYQ